MAKDLRIGIVDLGISNITSVSNAFKKIGYSCYFLCGEGEEVRVDIIVIPGVGNFDYLADCLKNSLLKNRILEHHNSGAPIIGICLGMQILFDSSKESLLGKGLGIMPGEVKSLKDEAGPHCGRYIPNIGYNSVSVAGGKSNFSKDEISNMIGQYYFLHSYAVFDWKFAVDLEGITKFGDKEFLAFFIKDNICGIQFHPERSGTRGLSFLSDIMKYFQKNYI